jgi:hypothetical protein
MQPTGDQAFNTQGFLGGLGETLFFQTITISFERNPSAKQKWLIPVILATQEDRGSKPANSSMKTYLEKDPSQKSAGGVAQGVGPEFKPQYCRKKKKRRKERLLNAYFIV